MRTQRQPPGRAFEKGNPGRPKGAKNKTTVEVRELAKRIVEDRAYLEGLAARINAGKAPHMEPILFYYAYGKPKERLEHTGPDGEPLSTTPILIYLPSNSREGERTE